jgi:heme-degrading monooxygenase HmoA
MTYVRVWRFRPLRNAEAAFESAYGPEGDWVRLFRTAPGFLGTTLLKEDGTGDYLTLDRWVSRDAYETFRRDSAAPFTALDRDCESLTSVEVEIGSYDEVGEAFEGR